MDRNRVTVRYARALIELASEQKVLEQISRDAEVMLEALSAYQGFSDFVLNPGTRSNDKFARIQTIFSNDFHPLTMKFFQLVFENKRETYLKDLCRNIVSMSHEMNGIVSASLSTAIELDPAMAEQIKQKFEKKIAASILMETEVNPSLIGGFVFTIDGLQYDASVASRLQAIEKQLQLK